MTIYDLAMDVEVQGNVVINKITEDDVIPVYQSEWGLTCNEKSEPYMNKEIIYMYASQIGLVIEYREED